MKEANDYFVNLTPCIQMMVLNTVT